jgi:hypothetical protein
MRHSSASRAAAAGRRWRGITAAATALAALAALGFFASGRLSTSSGSAGPPGMPAARLAQGAGAPAGDRATHKTGAHAVGGAAQDTVAKDTGAKDTGAQSVQSAAGATQNVLISKYMPAYASSEQDGPVWPPQAAVDDDPGTRWSSAPGTGTQWLEADLLSVATIRKVVLEWNGAYATAFKIQTSDNAKTWTTIYATTNGRGGTETLNANGTGRYVRVYATAGATQYGYSLWEFDIYGQPGPQPMMNPAPPPFDPNLDPGESITVNPPDKGTAEDINFVYPSYVTHFEFQTDCTVFKDAKNDPIVYPRKENQSAHMHAFMGALSVNAYSTTDSLSNAKTSCLTPQDHSGYWFPALMSGNKIINPVGPQVIYYKSGIYDYRAVQPFPKGLRFVVGNDMANEAQFEQAPGTVEGWECGNSYFNFTFPKSCPAGTDLVIRYQAPSCWDGVHLDVTDHQSNMAYPIHNAQGRKYCPPGYPVAVPMLEFKMAFPVSGDLAAMDLHLASGGSTTWHYDFFDAWNPTVLAALVKHCINQGLQCDTHGYDQSKPQFGAVLGPNYQLLG